MIRFIKKRRNVSHRTPHFPPLSQNKTKSDKRTDGQNAGQTDVQTDKGNLNAPLAPLSGGHKNLFIYMTEISLPSSWLRVLLLVIYILLWYRTAHYYYTLCHITTSPYLHLALFKHRQVRLNNYAIFNHSNTLIYLNKKSKI